MASPVGQHRRQFPALPLARPPLLTLPLQCDSKHPRCTACATAGTPCHQEDRHRQTLTLRGHTEHLEQKLAQCDAILKRRIPGFEMDNLDDILAREGVEVEAAVPPPISASFQFASGPGLSIFPSSSASSSHFVNPRRQLPSKRLSLCPSRTTHDAAWLRSYASLLCRSKWSTLPSSSTYATSPRLQSSLAPNVPAPPTAHSIAASSSRSICTPSFVFNRTRTGHQGRGPWFPRHVEPSGMYCPRSVTSISPP